MKRLFPLLFVAACGGGGSTSPDAGDDIDAATGGHTGTLTASWSIKNVDGTPATCFAGYPKMLVSGVPWTTEFDGPEPGAAPASGLFDCTAGSGTLQLPIDGTFGSDFHYNGKWDITFQQTDSVGQTVVATDVQSQVDRPVTVDLSGGSASTATTFYQDGGYLWFEWILFGTTAQDYLGSCAGAGVDKIEIVLTEHTSGVVNHVTFPCDIPSGKISGADGVDVEGIHSVGGGIAPIAAGDWDYVATAYAGATAVGTSSEGEDTVIDPKNHIAIFADLADITLTNR